VSEPGAPGAPTRPARRWPLLRWLAPAPPFDGSGAAAPVAQALSLLQSQPLATAPTLQHSITIIAAGRWQSADDAAQADAVVASFIDAFTVGEFSRHAIAINLVLPEGHPLSAQATANGMRVATVGRANAGPFALLRELQKLQLQRGFRLLVAATPAAHRAAIVYKSLSAWPVPVLRMRYPGSPYIAQGGFAHWFHNQWIAANLLLTQADLAVRRQSRPQATLDMENPVCLEQSGLTSGQMLARTACALLPDVTRASHAHIGLTYITHFYCNQSNIDAVVSLLRGYSLYPRQILDRIHFVIVDDGSPVQYEVPSFNLNLTWLKIDQDIRWNQSGARNLGAVYAKSDSILLTDVDHVFGADALQALLARGSCGKRLYRIHRRDPHSGEFVCSHPNIFLMSRARFFEFGGYDEEFAGSYGAEDARFAKHQQAHGTLLRHLPKAIYCEDRAEIDRDHGYHSLQRDYSFNTPIDSRKKLELVHFGAAGGHARRSLNFTWSTLSEQSRPAVELVRLDRSWWGPRRLLRMLSPRW
jgi:hypothetical protein